MKRTLAESELLYERVKAYFWRKEEESFIVLLSEGDMSGWKILPMSSIDEMEVTRLQLYSDRLDFAGFMDYEGRYSFYFLDRNLYKTQYLDTGEIDCFDVLTFSEFDLAAVAEEFKKFCQGS
jgi:hypothetical protein